MILSKLNLFMRHVLYLSSEAFFLLLQNYIQRLKEGSDLPFELVDGAFYFDPDIIDLTNIPPPATPDVSLQKVQRCEFWSDPPSKNQDGT